MEDGKAVKKNSNSVIRSKAYCFLACVLKQVIKSVCASVSSSTKWKYQKYATQNQYEDYISVCAHVCVYINIWNTMSVILKMTR